MTLDPPQPILSDAKALVTGIANEHSIACGCAPGQGRTRSLRPTPVRRDATY